jgi:hypothetical protein
MLHSNELSQDWSSRNSFVLTLLRNRNNNININLKKNRDKIIIVFDYSLK